MGALERATIGWFDFSSKTYRKIPAMWAFPALPAAGEKPAAGHSGAIQIQGNVTAEEFVS
jgi:hypothetical protein